MGTEALASETAPAKASKEERGFVDLFPADGVPEGWVVTAWDDLRKPAEPEAVWKVVDGVLHGSEPRGTWLVSKREYGDFELQLEFKLGEQGNSGLALRAPMHGDPAFDGLELQMADVRYNPEALPSELTGGVYRAIAPRKQVYKPTEWNRYEVKLEGGRLWVRLNGVVIHDTDLDEHTDEVKRHDGSAAPAIKDRPRRGHLGFQELSRGGAHVLVRGAKVRELK
jgi:hypothetical protein